MKLYRKKYQSSGPIEVNTGIKPAQETNVYGIDPFEKTIAVVADLYRQDVDPDFKVDTYSTTFYDDKGIPESQASAYFMPYNVYSDKLGVLASNNIHKHDYNGIPGDPNYDAYFGAKDSIAGIINHELNHALHQKYYWNKKENPLINTLQSPVFVEQPYSKAREKQQKDAEYLYNVNTMSDFLKNEWYTRTKGNTENVPQAINYMDWLSSLRNLVDPETISALDLNNQNDLPNLYTRMNYGTPFSNDYKVPKYPTDLTPYLDINNPNLVSMGEPIINKEGELVGYKTEPNHNEEWGATNYAYNAINPLLINATYAILDNRIDTRTPKQKQQDLYNTDIYQQKIKDLVKKSEYRKLTEEEQEKLEELRNDYMFANPDNARKQDLNTVKELLWYTGFRKYGGTTKQRYQYGGNDKSLPPHMDYKRQYPNVNIYSQGNDVPNDVINSEYKSDLVDYYMSNTAWQDYVKSNEYVKRLKKEGYKEPEKEQQRRIEIINTVPINITNSFLDIANREGKGRASAFYKDIKNYQKDYGVYLQFVEPEILKDNPKDTEHVLPHELTHAIFDNKEGLSDYAKSVFSDKNYIGNKKEKSYYGNPEEMIAFGSQLKAYLLSNKLWDPSKTFTSDDYDKLKKDVYINPDLYFLNTLSKQAVIDMMNNIAYKNNDSNIKHTKYGGITKNKYQTAGTIGINPNSEDLTFSLPTTTVTGKKKKDNIRTTYTPLPETKEEYLNTFTKKQQRRIKRVNPNFNNDPYLLKTLEENKIDNSKFVEEGGYKKIQDTYDLVQNTYNDFYNKIQSKDYKNKLKEEGYKHPNMESRRRVRRLQNTDIIYNPIAHGNPSYHAYDKSEKIFLSNKKGRVYIPYASESSLNEQGIFETKDYTNDITNTEILHELQHAIQVQKNKNIHKNTRSFFKNDLYKENWQDNLDNEPYKIENGAPVYRDRYKDIPESIKNIKRDKDIEYYSNPREIASYVTELQEQLDRAGIKKYNEPYDHNKHFELIQRGINSGKFNKNIINFLNMIDQSPDNMKKLLDGIAYNRNSNMTQS